MKDFIQKPEKEIERFRFFRWPDAMESSALSWESSRSCLDAWAYLRDHLNYEGNAIVTDEGPFIPEDRLRIDFMQAFWMVTQAAPDAPLSLRFLFTASFFASRFVGASLSASFPELLEPCLAYAPWKSEVHAAAYARAVARNRVLPFIDPQIVHTLYTDPHKAAALYVDGRMTYLYRMFGTNFFAGHLKEIETQWERLAALCRKNESDEKLKGKTDGRKRSRKN
jgi:hypothetical protein